MIKTLNQVGLERIYLIITRDIISPQLTSYLIVKAKSCSCKIRNKTRMFAHSCQLYSSQYQKSQPEQLGKKRNEDIQNGEEKVKLTIYRRHDMILRKPKKCTRKTVKTNRQIQPTIKSRRIELNFLKGEVSKISVLVKMAIIISTYFGGIIQSCPTILFLLKVLSINFSIHQ